MRDIFIKNAIIVVSWLLLYPVTENSFAVIQSKDVLSTAILFVGLIIVAPLFANFAYTYRETPRRKYDMLLGHVTTGLMMWVIGVLLIITDVLFIKLVGDILIFRITLASLVAAVVLYDFWDYRRKIALKEK